MTRPGGDSGSELVAVTASAEREAARLRDRLAEIEVEQATLEAELAAFNADYMREVMTVMLDVQELEARILALLGTRSGARDDAEARPGAPQSGRARRRRGGPQRPRPRARDDRPHPGGAEGAGPTADRRHQAPVPRGGQADA